MDYPPEITAGVSIILWIGFGGMLSGSITFLIFKFWKNEGRDIFYTLTFLAACIGAVSYLAAALEFGQMVVGTNRRIYWCRYLDWILSTPLLLSNLLLLNPLNTYSNIVFLIGVDMLMFSTGFLGALMISEMRFAFWGFSAFMFVLIVRGLWQQIRSVVDNCPENAGLFKILCGIVAFSWTMYPLVWLLSGEGLELLPFIMDVGMIAVTDVLSKIVFGLVLLTIRTILGDKERGFGESTALLRD